MHVDRKGYKLDVFLRKLAKHLTLTDTIRWSSGDHVYYLGGGYWRAMPLDKDGAFVDPYEDDQVNIVGVRLINPDRTPEELNTIAQAITILI